MAKQTIGLGSAANDNTGDTLRVGGDKVNDNFNEIYTALGNGTTLTVDTTNPAVGQVLRYNGATFLPSDYTNLTAALDVNGNSIVSSSNGNIAVATNGSGDLTLSAGGVTSIFKGTKAAPNAAESGTIIFPTSITYDNEYSTLAGAPAVGTYRGYFFTVSGDDNPYVNMNITAGGVGNSQVKLLTERSSINMLFDVDTTTTPPNNDQVLKWNSSSSKWLPADDSAGIGSISISDDGDGYTSSSAPTVTIQTPASGVGTATGVVQVDADNNTISRVLISDAGIGYTANPTISVSGPAIVSGIGTYQFGELVVGSISGAKGRVKKWDLDDRILNLGSTNKDFNPGELAVGQASGAQYAVDKTLSDGFNDKYDKGTEIETAADDIIDFSEGNPFGTF